MYADQVAAGGKPSVKDRLQGTGPATGRQFTGIKRQRPEDSKWKHDLYMDTEGPQSSRPRLSNKDLRLRLLRSGSERSQRSGVRDLREKLSGTMQPVTGNAQVKLRASKATTTTTARTVAAAPSVTKTARIGAQPHEQPAAETKKAAATTSAASKKKTQQKAEESVDQFLQSLGLEKYQITFQAEEVDMDALIHMTDEDLRALGVPMGPRKKIRLALDSRKP